MRHSNTSWQISEEKYIPGNGSGGRGKKRERLQEMDFLDVQRSREKGQISSFPFGPSVQLYMSDLVRLYVLDCLTSVTWLIDIQCFRFTASKGQVCFSILYKKVASIHTYFLLFCHKSGRW